MQQRIDSATWPPWIAFCVNWSTTGRKASRRTRRMKPANSRDPALNGRCGLAWPSRVFNEVVWALPFSYPAPTRWFPTVEKQCTNAGAYYLFGLAHLHESECKGFRIVKTLLHRSNLRSPGKRRHSLGNNLRPRGWQLTCGATEAERTRADRLGTNLSAKETGRLCWSLS